MKYFENSVSNSIAGSGSQKTFSMQKGETRVSRVYYKIACGGTFDYSFLYTNVIDSTFADGSECHKNYVCDEWELLGLRAAVTNGCAPDEPFINAISESRRVRSRGGFISFIFVLLTDRAYPIRRAYT